METSSGENEPANSSWKCDIISSDWQRSERSGEARLTRTPIVCESSPVSSLSHAHGARSLYTTDPAPPSLSHMFSSLPIKKPVALHRRIADSLLYHLFSIFTHPPSHLSLLLPSRSSCVWVFFLYFSRKFLYPVRRVFREHTVPRRKVSLGDCRKPHPNQAKAPSFGRMPVHNHND